MGWLMWRRASSSIRTWARRGNEGSIGRMSSRGGGGGYGAAAWRSTRGCGGLMRGSVTGAHPPPSMVARCIPSTPLGCKGGLIHQGAAAAKQLALPFLPRALYDCITRLPRSWMVCLEMERRRILWKTQIIRTPVAGQGGAPDRDLRTELVSKNKPSSNLVQVW